MTAHIDTDIQKQNYSFIFFSFKKNKKNIVKLYVKAHARLQYTIEASFFVAVDATKGLKSKSQKKKGFIMALTFLDILLNGSVFTKQHPLSRFLS